MPSDLFAKYDCEGGFVKLEFDLAIASEISERITEQHEEIQSKQSSSRAKKAVAKRNQKRATVSGEKINSVMEKWVEE
jgi:hypothetical protein